MQEQDYKTIARSRLTDRHRSDESFLAILDTLIELKEERQREYLSLAENFLDIDKSTGKNLDVIGKLIGEERTLVNFIDRSYFGFLGARLSEAYDFGYWYSLYKNKYGTLRTLTDEEYRRVLKARVIKNSSDNGRNSLLEVLNILTDNEESVVFEYENNTAIEVRIKDEDGLTSYYLSKYKSVRNLIPVPLGRRLTVVQIQPTYFTSKPYPIHHLESISTNFGVNDGELKLPIVADEENINTSFSIESVSFRTPQNTVNAEVENISTSLVLNGVQITKRVVFLSTTAEVESLKTGFALDGIQITKTVGYLSTTMDVENIQTVFALNGIQITN